MIGITFNVENIATVLQAYNQIQCIRYISDITEQPETPVGTIVSLTDWAVVSGTEAYPFPIDLESGTTIYMGYDPLGDATDWYSSRYYNSTNDAASAWSAPILGSEGDLFYDPIYPDEVSISDEDMAIITRIRTYIGDPKGLRREFGEEALASLHPDRKTFELAEKGWPVYITMGGKAFTSSSNPAVNGYRYLRFQEPVDDICYSCLEDENLCGDVTTKLMTSSIDVWYQTFRLSDKQILAAYDNCFPPPPLTTSTANTQCYVLQTAIDLITQELFEDSIEDGRKLQDDKSVYDPSSGMAIRKGLLDKLKKDLDDLVKSLMFTDLQGVLID